MRLAIRCGSAHIWLMQRHTTRFVYIELHDQDADGNASVTFFASDTSRRYLVTIEGVSDDGTIVHQQQVIE